MPLVVTEIVIVFEPITSAIFPDALPEVTEAPLIVTVPEDSVGVRVIFSIPFPKVTA